MTREPVVVVGAGGFGREALDVLEAIGTYDVLGVLDIDPSAENLDRLAERGTPYLGTEDDWIAAGGRAGYVIGVGEPAMRARVAEKFAGSGLAAATLIHPSAVIGSRVTLDEGVVVCGGVQVSTNVRLGRFVHLNANATIGHDSVLSDFVSINPAATISGAVTIGTRSLVGAGAVVLQNLEVGEDAVVGASACVVRNVPNGATVKGIPAR